MNSFESMTDLPEWKELIRDWRTTQEIRQLRDLGQSILLGPDEAAARRVASAHGFLLALDSFDRYVATRTTREPSLHPVAEKIQSARSSHRSK